MEKREGPIELEVIATLKQRVDYERFHPHLNPKLLQPATVQIISAIADYYDEHPEDIAIPAWDSMRTYFIATRSDRLPASLVEVCGAVFERLNVGDYSGAVLDDVRHHYLRRYYAQQIADLGTSALHDNDVDLADVLDMVENYDKDSGRVLRPEDIYTPITVASIAEKVLTSGWQWRLKALRDSLGPLRGGNFVLVAARPEVGKTTFVASEVTYIAQQMHKAGETRPIYWHNNEQASDEVAARLVQAALGQPLAALKSTAAAADVRVEALLGKGRIRLVRTDAGINHRKHLEAAFKETKPALIVFDQLDKVAGFDSRSEDDRPDLQLGRAYWWARELGHRYNCPVIAISQADGTAGGVKYVTMEQLRGSKTDKPGEADVIVTLGVDPEGAPDLRYINICKNKLPGPLNEELRHGKHVVRLDAECARFYDDTSR